MHVGLNLVFLVPGETGGTEVYARELIPALRAARPDIRLTAFINRETAAAGDGPWGTEIPAVTVPVHARRRAEWVRGEQVLLPRVARRAGVDLVHSLANTAPVAGRFRRIVTIHDLLYRMVPESHFGLRGLGMRALVPLGARATDRVITGTRSARADVLAHLHVRPERVDVVYDGLGATPAPPLPEAEVRARLGAGPRPILLSVSTKRPHKNLPRLLTALATIPAGRRPLLVLPGYPTPHEDELRAQALAAGIAEDVRFPGWIGADELEGLYAAAAAFVFPSLYEGFGLPILEAMRRGVPVACSRGGATGEVAGEAALTFDPLAVGEIATVITRLLEDGDLADRLRAAGPLRAAEFGWDRCARGTAESYERALRAPPRGGALPWPR